MTVLFFKCNLLFFSIVCHNSNFVCLFCFFFFFGAGFFLFLFLFISVNFYTTIKTCSTEAHAKNSRA